MRTESDRRHRIVSELRSTGPLRAAEVVRRLDGEMTRLQVLRALDSAARHGEVEMDLLGRAMSREDRSQRTGGSCGHPLDGAGRPRLPGGPVRQEPGSRKSALAVGGTAHCRHMDTPDRPGGVELEHPVWAYTTWVRAWLLSLVVMGLAVLYHAIRGALSWLTLLQSVFGAIGIVACLTFLVVAVFLAAAARYRPARAAKVSAALGIQSIGMFIEMLW